MTTDHGHESDMAGHANPPEDSWASDLLWREQPRPENGCPPANIPEPFRGWTFEDSQPTEPAAQYTAEEVRLRCPLGGVPEISTAPTFAASYMEKVQTPIGSPGSTGWGSATRSGPSR
ncbi:hypothetical protein HPB47_002887 [Ixodes persulcatus]|uniref:Uncharacterized protein n=1 Tax=Ixodes persulcatus TaxID=34615 RepID=A0AC60PL37_IXOPE|nr:hypothetical protein HPB47_002887 [Ixodes persulcatus]